MMWGVSVAGLNVQVGGCAVVCFVLLGLYDLGCGLGLMVI